MNYSIFTKRDKLESFKGCSAGRFVKKVGSESE